MKYYRYLLISIILLIFHSCRQEGNVLEYELKNLRATIEIPTVYGQVNKERLDRILVKKEDQSFKNELLNMIHNDKNIKMLIDTIKPYKFILHTEKVSYVKIDTNSLYILIDNERKSSSSRPEVKDSTYFVGSRLDSISGFKFIESKYTRISGNRRRIGYTYVISDDTRTSGISFFSPDEQDARKYIKTILKTSGK